MEGEDQPSLMGTTQRGNWDSWSNLAGRLVMCLEVSCQVSGPASNVWPWPSLCANLDTRGLPAYNILIMGKYKRKYECKPCEFTYKNRWFGKESGETCGRNARKCYDGKYLCGFHCPKRVLIRKQKDSLRGIKTLAQQEARIQERKKRYEEVIAAMNNDKPKESLLGSAFSFFQRCVV